MFIVNPLTGRKVQFANLFMTHPPTADRVARLRVRRLAPVTSPANMGAGSARPPRMPRPLIVIVASMAGAIALVAAAFQATAQTADPGPTTTTTTGAPPTTTPVPARRCCRGRRPRRPARQPPEADADDDHVDAPDAGPSPGRRRRRRAPGAPMVVPPEYWPLINSVKRSKPNSTVALLAALRPWSTIGLTQDQVVRLGFGRFPVAGPATFSDDWWMPRFTPVFHLHQGNDIFAAEGTPVRAPADGVLRQSSEAVGGLSDYLTLPDGTYFYMAHLSAFVAGPEERPEGEGGRRHRLRRRHRRRRGRRAALPLRDPSEGRGGHRPQALSSTGGSTKPWRPFPASWPPTRAAARRPCWPPPSPAGPPTAATACSAARHSRPGRSCCGRRRPAPAAPLRLAGAAAVRGRRRRLARRRRPPSRSAKPRPAPTWPRALLAP